MSDGFCPGVTISVQPPAGIAELRNYMAPQFLNFVQIMPKISNTNNLDRDYFTIDRIWLVIFDTC